MAKDPKFRRIASDDGTESQKARRVLGVGSSAPAKKIDFKAEARLFCNLAAPNVIVQVFSFLLWMENSMYVGRTLGTTELAAVSLGNMCGNLTGLSLVFGMMSALDTLAPQAMGCKQYAEVGVLVQRATWLSMFLCLPCFAMWLNMESILLFLKQPAAASALAGRFLRVYCLGLPPIVLFEVSRRFLGCQNIVYPYCLISGVVALVTHPFCLWFFITYCGFGFIGTPMAIVASQWLLLLITMVYIRYFQVRPLVHIRWYTSVGTSAGTTVGAYIRWCLHPLVLLINWLLSLITTHCSSSINSLLIIR
jgi:MATE family multidrug resistance protein